MGKGRLTLVRTISYSLKVGNMSFGSHSNKVATP